MVGYQLKQEQPKEMQKTSAPTTINAMKIHACFSGVQMKIKYANCGKVEEHLRDVVNTRRKE